MTLTTRPFGVVGVPSQHAFRAHVYACAASRVVQTAQELEWMHSSWH